MTTLATYEDRLEAFARGKRLRRFRGMVRNPKDPTCDACDSVMPNHLWGLRDMETGQDYFVGQSCLAFLSRMLVIERPFVRANLRRSFERARGEETASDEKDRQFDRGVPIENRPTVGAAPQGRAHSNGGSGDIQVIESDEIVTVLVRAASACGRYEAWGAASEARYREVWRQDTASYLVLRPATELNRDAVALCLARAQHMAHQELEAAQGAPQAKPAPSAS